MNISFREYVKIQQDKAYNHQNVEVPVVKKEIVKPVVSAPVKEKDAFDYIKEINPQIWTAKIVKNKICQLFVEILRLICYNEIKRAI